MKIKANDINIIFEEAGVLVNIEDLKEDVDLIEQGLDSLDMANIYLLIEEKFNINIPESDIQNLKKINDILNYINQKLEKRENV